MCEMQGQEHGRGWDLSMQIGLVRQSSAQYVALSLVECSVNPLLDLPGLYRERLL